MNTVCCNYLFFYCGHGHPVQFRKDRLVDPMYRGDIYISSKKLVNFQLRSEMLVSSDKKC